MTNCVVTVDDGAELNVVEEGAGPAVVLLHGIMLSSAIWKYQLAGLRDTYRVIALDQRGHGRSRSGSEGHGFDRYARDLIAVLDQLDVRDATVVGHSMGGSVVLTAAAFHRSALAGRARAIAVTGATDAAVLSWPAGEALLRAGAWASRLAIRAAARWPGAIVGAGRVSTAVTRLAFGDDPEAASVELTRAVMAGTSLRELAAMSHNMVGYDLRAEVGTIDLPALVLHGERDRLVSRSNAQALAARLADGRFIPIPGAGHMAMLERPQAFNAELARFVARAGVARP